jgi:HD-like signal output (HDOD) protein
MMQAATGCRQLALKALADLPPFSPVLDRLMATLTNESVSISKVSDIVEADTVIAGNVLKLVNSALYGRRGTVNSVRHAVSLLGINKVRNAVFAMSISRVWGKVRTAPGWSTSQFNRHSVGCGLMCDFLAQRLPVTYPEGAFAGGLFHDLGSMLIAVALHPEYQQIQELYTSGFGSITQCELEVIGVSHVDLSADALAVWNLPASIQKAVRSHSEPGAEDLETGGEYSLASIIHCADEYVENNGMSLFTTSSAESPPMAEPFARLGLALAAIDWLEQFRTECDALMGAFQ